MSSRIQATRSSRRFQISATAPPGAQDARDLRRRRPGIEPVERLGGDHGVDARVGERDRLGHGVERLGGRRRLRQHVAHARHGLECDHPGAAAGEQPRELARARAELEQRPPGSGAGRR